MKTKENKGVTLIALAVTIIVMLILAGVTVSTLTGNSGITAKAQLAKKMSKVSSEKEAIQLAVSLAKMEKYLDEDNEYYIGIPLYDKTLENGNKWNIVMINDTQKIYGTDWCFISKGTEISKYGETQYNWLVNYETGELEQLEDNTFTQLMYGSNLAVKEGLILNVDPINMADSTSWGSNVKLHGVKDGDGYGWNGTEINFDGVDDYLEVYNGFEMNEGITFEFYGKSNDDIMMLSKTIVGDNRYVQRFRTKFYRSRVFQCCMSSRESKSDWSVGGGMKHWIYKANLKSFNSENGSYITMTVNLNNNTLTLYQEGTKIGATVCSGEWLRNGGLTDNSIPFTIGLLIDGNTYTENYSKMSLYSCRLYNKVLTDEEVNENYNKTVAYHNMIISK
ncbi:MAG: hypothetical protein ACLR8F_02450 [Clostridia bacterium]